MWRGRHVVLGVSGGIASYKSCQLARRLTEAGAAVDVVLTRGAAEFVGPATFEALTGRPVLTSLWEPGRALAHVRLPQDAHLIIVAPATVASIYGMNFTHMPELNYRWSYPAVLLLMASMCTILYVKFKRSGWL